MDPLVLVLVPGFLGGLALALLLHRLHPGSPPVGPVHREMLSTDVINMARIRVAGVGGLGLVALSFWIAVFVPRIGRTMTIGFVLGAAVALILIMRRRRTGAMPSSGRHPGAALLPIDSPATESEVARNGRERTSNIHQQLAAWPMRELLHHGGPSPK